MIDILKSRKENEQLEQSLKVQKIELPPFPSDTEKNYGPNEELYRITENSDTFEKSWFDSKDGNPYQQPGKRIIPGLNKQASMQHFLGSKDPNHLQFSRNKHT